MRGVSKVLCPKRREQAMAFSNEGLCELLSRKQLDPAFEVRKEPIGHWQPVAPTGRGNDMAEEARWMAMIYPG